MIPLYFRIIHCTAPYCTRGVWRSGHLECTPRRKLASSLAIRHEPAQLPPTTRNWRQTTSNRPKPRQTVVQPCRNSVICRLIFFLIAFLSFPDTQLYKFACQFVQNSLKNNSNHSLLKFPHLLLHKLVKRKKLYASG